MPEIFPVVNRIDVLMKLISVKLIFIIFIGFFLGDVACFIISFLSIRQGQFILAAERTSRVKRELHPIDTKGFSVFFPMQQ